MDVWMVQDGALNTKLLLLAASALLERRGQSHHVVFKAGTFYSTWSCRTSLLKQSEVVLNGALLCCQQGVYHSTKLSGDIHSLCIHCWGRAGCLMGEAGVWLALLQCPGNTSVPLHGLEWGEKLNFVAIPSKTVMETEKFSLQLSVWGNWYILRIRARKRTGCFGKLYLCWP